MMKYHKLWGQCVACIFLSVSGHSAFASGLLVPDSELRDDLAWLADRGVIHLSTSTWPLSQEEVERELKRARPEFASELVVLARVDHRLAVLRTGLLARGHSLSGGSGTPHGFAATAYARQSASLIVSAGTDNLDLHLQGNVEGNMQVSNGSRYNLNGSYGAVLAGNQWLAFGQIPQWWGPGNEGSLIRSDAARPVTGFLLQRAEQTAPDTWWMRWTGPWQYQLSAGQLSQYTAVPHTLLTGGRLTLSPWSSLELGTSRMMMWGGEGRSESLSTFWDGVTGKDNTGSENEPGDQLAGFDFTFRLEPTLGWPVSLYAQMIGEDEAGLMPSAGMYLGGIEGHHSAGKNAVNWYLEAHDTRSGMSRTGYIYTHHIYTDGYYQQGAPLGDAMGGDGRLLAARTELVAENGQRWSARVVYARVNPESEEINQDFPDADTLKGIQLSWSGDIYRSVRLTAGVWYTASQHDDSDAGIGAGVEIPLDL
ncbi:capsule assembly Wzi family protein [Lelliottia sp. V106_10]|uniref:capsule assembly Wzi family protein n=1 Tax=Lelliottia wanjuensis TaxID=3050585 RepID=UPI00254A8371|nr:MULTISPECIES: capsule assembly Wzi family protein [unclassified Lelliottia]MDK9358869.1 capsule assembly Wzi family protein [Lelliottia sp. V106_16]MDK9373556.1 capsule assembly Wzi family protein [Lelliottia sp. V106_10]MDK9600403.1 capsule assembly Wzi family protein [Lelliottia sp. V106_5]